MRHHYSKQCLNCFSTVSTMEKLVMQAFLDKKPILPRYQVVGGWLRCKQTRGVTVHQTQLPTIVTESDCGQLFENFTSFQLHYKNAHFPYGPFGDLFCEKCELFFDSPIEAKNHHKKICASKNPFNCKFCSSVFKTFRALVWHEIRKHGNKHGSSKHKCFVCNKIFDEKPELDKHLRAHPRLECSVCGTKLRTLKSLKDHHSRLHSKPKIKPFETEQQRQLDYFNEHGATKTISSNVLYKNRPTPHCGHLLVNGYYRCPAMSCICRCISESHFFAHWTNVHLSFETDSVVKGVSKCMFCEEILPYKDHKKHINTMHHDSPDE